MVSQKMLAFRLIFDDSYTVLKIFYRSDRSMTKPSCALNAATGTIQLVLGFVSLSLQDCVPGL